jgi:thiamine-phosphate pyrophosphorylase
LAARRLPPGSGVIYRAFGAPDAVHTGRALRWIADQRRLILLVGADEALARAIGADGLHLPERLAARAPLILSRHPRWIVTAAVHSSLGLRRAEHLGVDACVVAPVFLSNSPSAGRAIGATRLALWIGPTSMPVIALGGVNNDRAPGLLRTGAYGLAAVEALSG